MKLTNFAMLITSYIYAMDMVSLIRSGSSVKIKKHEISVNGSRIQSNRIKLFKSKPTNTTTNTTLSNPINDILEGKTDDVVNSTWKESSIYKEDDDLSNFMNKYRDSCSDDTSCNNGVCNKTSFICICSYGYESLFKLYNATNPDTIQDYYSQCKYHQKKGLYAFILSIVGIGFGHIYIGKTNMALEQFWFVLLVIIFYFIFNCCKKNPISELKNFAHIVFILLVIALIYWWLYDAYNFFRNNYKDKFGISLI